MRKEGKVRVLRKILRISVLCFAIVSLLYSLYYWRRMYSVRKPVVSYEIKVLHNVSDKNKRPLPLL